MTKIMLLGAGGQLGQAFLAQALPPHWEILAFDHKQLDLTDRHAVRNVFNNNIPDLVINAAAMTNVDAAEKEEEKATAINFDAPANLAALCSSNDVPMIHISTDYVFDGDHETPYLPDDPVNPINVYGKTKFLGEEAVREELAWHVILRISSVFSSYSNNLLTNTLRWLDEKDALQIVSDQIICPTYADDVAKALIKISTEILAGKVDGFGLFQFCGTPAVTRYEFVEEVMAAYKPYAAKLPTLSPTTMGARNDPAKRPAYSVLHCGRIQSLYGIEQSDWKKGVRESIDLLMQKRKAAP